MEVSNMWEFTKIVQVVIDEETDKMLTEAAKVFSTPKTKLAKMMICGGLLRGETFVKEIRNAPQDCDWIENYEKNQEKYYKLIS